MKSSNFRRSAKKIMPSVMHPREGGFIVLAMLCLAGCFAFASLSIDVGYLGVTKTRMQNGVDAAALAAVQEIANAVRTAPPGTQNVTAYAIDEARDVAAEVASLNNIYVDKDRDVYFGQRVYDPSSKTYSIRWGVTPANTVKVVALRNNSDTSAPDGKLPLFFAGIAGDKYATVQAQAIAYVEARDIVITHDFSRSMNFDSQFSDEASSRLSDDQIINNLTIFWNDLTNYKGDVFGDLDVEQEYLTVPDTKQNVATSVTFRYDEVDVVTTGNLQSVKLQYDNYSSETFDVSGKKATVSGSRDITNVTVTSLSDSGQTQQVEMKSGKVTATISADRKSVDLTSKKSMSIMQILFQDGSFEQVNLHNSKSYQYTPSKPIDGFRVSMKGKRKNWQRFDPPDNGSGESQTVTQHFDDNSSTIKKIFNLDDSAYPFPRGSWNEFIDHCKDYRPFANRGLRETYGGLTFSNYLLRKRSSHRETPAICQVRHYPFSSIKQGHSLLCDFLDNLGFDDHLGMVSYDTNHRVETILDESDPNIPNVDISSEPISSDFVSVNNLMKYKQANHYSPSTNMGGGLGEAIELLQNHARGGTRPTILLMTDGNSNKMDSGETGTLPWDWDWDKLFDYDGDGNGDYYTSSWQSRYVLKQAFRAKELGYTIHTMGVGMDADRNLLRAIAHLGGGTYIDVPGGVSVLDMEDQLLDGFYKIASRVPPAKLISTP